MNSESKLPRRARDGELVGLREVEDDVGDVPPLAGRRRELEVRLVQPVQQPRQLGVLLAQRGDDLVHLPATSDEYGPARASHSMYRALSA